MKVLQDICHSTVGFQINSSILNFISVKESGNGANIRVLSCSFNWNIAHNKNVNKINLQIFHLINCDYKICILKVNNLKTACKFASIMKVIVAS